jgi:uncharacterized protein YidB (DUF937 family)
MGLFDKFKEKSLEKMLEMAGGQAPEELLKNVPGGAEAAKAGLAEMLKGMNISSLMAMFQNFKPGQPVTAEQMKKVFTPQMINQLAFKLNIPADQAPTRLAAMATDALSKLPRQS